MPDAVSFLRTEELLPGEFWNVYQNERTGQITKVPKKVMENPETWKLYMAHMAGYRSPADYPGSGDPAKEGYEQATHRDIMNPATGSGPPGPFGRVAAAAGDAIRRSPEDEILRRRDALASVRVGEMDPLDDLLRRRDALAQVRVPVTPHNPDNLNMGPADERSPMTPEQHLDSLLKRRDAMLQHRVTPAPEPQGLDGLLEYLRAKAGQ